MGRRVKELLEPGQDRVAVALVEGYVLHAPWVRVPGEAPGLAQELIGVLQRAERGERQVLFPRELLARLAEAGGPRGAHVPP